MELRIAPVSAVILWKIMREQVDDLLRKQRDHHGKQGALRLRHTVTGPLRPTISSWSACVAKNFEIQSRWRAGNFSKVRSVTTTNRAAPMLCD